MEPHPCSPALWICCLVCVADPQSTTTPSSPFIHSALMEGVMDSPASTHQQPPFLTQRITSTILNCSSSCRGRSPWMMTCLKIACRGRSCRMVFIREVSSISTAKVVLPTTWTLPAKFASLRQARQASATPRVFSRSSGLGRDRLAVLAIVPSDVDRADAERELRPGHLSVCMSVSIFANLRPLARSAEAVIKAL